MNRSQDIQSVKAFLKENNIEFLINYCNLYPVDSWKRWTDHLGNFIQINKNKKITSFVFNPLDLDEQIITDLFQYSRPEQIASISKKIFISEGEGYNFYWFLGEDNRLRLITSKEGFWIKNNPVMSCGINSILPIINFINSDFEGKADILGLKGPISIIIKNNWVGTWPLSNKIKNQLPLKLKEELCSLE